MPLFPILSGRKLAAMVSLASLAVATANAATLTVTTTADAGAGSLRDTIAAASDGDTIEFAPGVAAITLTSAELAIGKDIRISGPGSSQLEIGRQPASGTPHFRIFHILSGRTVTIEGLTISGGGTAVDGSGIRNESATLTIDRCVVRNCIARGAFGGGIYNAASGSGSSATLTILNSTITGNEAYYAGGGIYNDGSNGGNASLTILNSLVTNNVAAHSTSLFDFRGEGGGIYNSGIATLTITKSIVSNNRAGFNSYTFGTFPNGTGGGIYNIGSVTIVDSEIFNNNCGLDGAGISNHGVVTITGSTLTGNIAYSDHDGVPYGTGAGISSNGGLTITNSTLSNNNANKSGGAISNGGLLKIVHSTLSGNNALNGGGIANGNNGSVHIGNTIVKTGTSGVNIVNTGTFTSDGYNLSSDDGGGFLTAPGDQINTDPMLGPLQNNGGSTATHAPLTGSPAIDAGDPNFTPPPLYDQRGPYHVRVFNGRLDIGSVEVQPTPVPTPTPTPTSTPSPTATPTPTATPASLGNISTRLRVETGDTVLIGGFIITGNASKRVVLRGIGPSLAGLGLSDVLADPILELREANGALIFQDDDWQDNSQQASQLSALGLAPQNQKESGIVAELAPAAYTAVLAGKNNSTGLGLVEIYDTTQGSGSQLGNISSRGLVRTGDHVMIGGFILGGGSGSTSQIVVRGIGPSLAQFGLNPVLTDPTLELRNADGAVLLSNDDWQDDSASAAQLVSHHLAPQHPKESGIYSELPPGAFTAILAGKNGGTGIGLVEIYNVP
jgi:hypothetical protein